MDVPLKRILEFYFIEGSSESLSIILTLGSDYVCSAQLAQYKISHKYLSSIICLTIKGHGLLKI